MGLDIRWPIGFMFSLFGVLMALNGLITAGNAEIYKRSLDININLWWGLVLLVFGVFMLMMAWRGARKEQDQQPANPKELQIKK